jgi:hypothetical protein
MNSDQIRVTQDFKIPSGDWICHSSFTASYQIISFIGTFPTIINSTIARRMDLVFILLVFNFV